MKRRGNPRLQLKWSERIVEITTLVAHGAGVVALLVCPGCGEPECKVGEKRFCEGSKECGVQLCAGDPAHWLACECKEPDPVVSTVGEACSKDSDCTGDEICFEGSDASYLDGVPVASWCTQRCDAEPELCDSLTPPSVCVVTDNKGTEDAEDDVAHCFAPCEIGADPMGKCLDRPEFACAALASFDTTDSAATANQDAVCRPLCTADDECDADSYCNLLTGACQAGQRASGLAPLGEPCDVDADEQTCEGICVEVSGVSFCSNRCWFGDAGDCSGNSNVTGLCRFPEEENGLIGDVGFCGKLCNTPADCSHPELDCEAFDDAAIEALVGASGVCSPI